MANLIIGAIEFLIGIACSIQQMNTTHDSVVSALQGGTLITSHLTAAQLLTVLNGNADKYNRIGWFVALVTQTIFWGTIMPASPVSSNGLHKAVVVLFFCLEVVTDIWYSIATATTLGGVFTFIFTFGASGLIGSLAYVIAMTTGSIFLLVKGIHRLEKALGPVFAAQHKPAVAASK